MHEAPAHAADLRVSIDRDLDVPDLVALLNRGKEVLHAVLDPLHRPAEQPRRGGDGDFFRIDEELGAEAAADVGGADADAVIGHAEERRERHPQIVRHLRRRPNRQAVFAGLVARDRAAAFDRMRGAAVLQQAFAEDMCGADEGVRHVAVGHLELRQHIGLRFASHFRRARCERSFQVGDERQRLVVDLDRSHRVLGEVARFGDHHRHRLADEAHLARREHEGRDVLR